MKNNLIKIVPFILLIGLLFRIPPHLDWSYFARPEEWGSELKRAGMMAVMIWIVMGCIAIWLWEHSKAFSLFFVLAVVMSIYPVYRGPLYVPLGCLTAYALWYLFWVRSDFSFDTICNAICVVGLIQVALTISQRFFYDPIFNLEGQHQVHRAVGFFSNANFGSAMIAVCLPAFFRGWWKLFIPVLVYGLVITTTTGSFLGAVVACAVGAMVYYRGCSYSCGVKSILIITGLFVAVLAYTYVDNPNMTRLGNWQAFTKLNRVEHKKYDYSGPSPGLGFGSANEANVLFINKGGTKVLFTHAHNDWLEGWIDLGWPVIPVYVLFLIQLFRRFKYNIIAGMGVLTACIIAGVSYPMSIATIAAIVLVWLAMMDRGISEKGAMK